MNPVGEFTLIFNAKGIEEFSDKLDKTLDKLDGVGSKEGPKATKTLDSLLLGFKRLIPQITAATTLLKGFRTALELKDTVIDMQNMATAIGVGADKLEGMGRALRQFKGDWKTAGAFYGRVTDMMTDLYWGKLDKSELISKYGIDIVSSLQNRDYEGVMRGISNAMNKQEFAGFRREISNGLLGGDQSLQLFFSQDWATIAQQLESAGDKNFKSSTEYQRQSRELLESTQNLKEAWEKASIELMPALTSLITAITPIMEALKPLFEGLGILIQSIAPIIQWVADKVGGAFKFVGAGLESAGTLFSGGFDLLTGKRTGDEVLAAINQTTAGQWTNNLIDDLKTQQIKNALGNLAVGRYNTADRDLIRTWLESPDMRDKWNTPEWNRAMDLVKVASAELDATNTPLNSMGTITNSNATDNRAVNIDRIEVYDTTGTWLGKGQQIGNILSNSINGGAFNPMINTKGAL